MYAPSGHAMANERPMTRMGMAVSSTGTLPIDVSRIQNRSGRTMAYSKYPKHSTVTTIMTAFMVRSS
jgi:hypothetical protein